MDDSVAFVAVIFFLHFPHVNFQEFVYECFAIVQWDEGVYICMKHVCMGEIICIGRPEMPLSILKVGQVDF